MTREKLTYNIIGNPGSGKSTIINTVFQEHKCNSGSAKGRNTTEIKAVTMCDGNDIVDTMGLADMSMRKEAANGITTALKANQHMKIIFVIDGQRLQAQDAQSVCDVIGSITIPHKDIHYGIIINKLDDEWSETDCDELAAELLAALKVGFMEFDKAQSEGKRVGMDKTDTTPRNDPVFLAIQNQGKLGQNSWMNALVQGKIINYLSNSVQGMNVPKEKVTEVPVKADQHLLDTISILKKQLADAKRAQNNKKYLKDLIVHHVIHQNAIKEIDGYSNDINKGFGGADVSLEPIWTTDSSEACTSVRFWRNPAAQSGYTDMAKGTGGDYRYIEVEREDGPKIVEVCLWRTSRESSLPSSRGFKYCVDLNQGRRGDYLYICWKTE